MLGSGFQRLVLVGFCATVACGGNVSSPSDDVGREAGTGTNEGGASQVRLDAATPADTGSARMDSQPNRATDPDASVEASTNTDAPGTTSSTPYDGTTGTACQTDSDCKSANGPGGGGGGGAVFAPDDYYPTPVCILPSCDTVSDATSLHYCDGPDDPSSPGLCVALGTTSAGTCVPKCSFDTHGTPSTGCIGKDTCRTFTPAAESGYGYCWGGCATDSDCESGQHCQTDRGTCLAGVVAPTKSIGEACTVTDTNDYACHCFYGGASQTGYCSTFCIVGGAPTCPSGYVCDSIEYRSDGYSVDNRGMYGWCVAACTTTDGGATCPANSTCSDVNAAGPDCTP